MKPTKISKEGPIKGITKQSGFWAHSDKNSMSPLVYLQRPKWIKDDASWSRIVAGITIDITQGEIK